MTDLIHLMGSLVDVNGHIQVPGIKEQVAPLTEEESALYEPIAFDMVRLGKKETSFVALL